MPGVARIKLYIGSEEILVQNYKNDDVPAATEFSTMNGSDYVDIPLKYGFSFDYVIQKGKTDFNFITNLSGTQTVRYVREGGGSVLFSEVKCMTEGGESYDASKEAIKTITCMAKRRTVL